MKSCTNIDFRAIDEEIKIITHQTAFLLNLPLLLSEHLCNQIRKNTETIRDLELFLN